MYQKACCLFLFLTGFQNSSAIGRRIAQPLAQMEWRTMEPLDRVAGLEQTEQ